MTEYTCKHCGATHSDPAAMLMRKGRPSQVCRDCWTSGRKGGGKAVKAKVHSRNAKSQPAAAPEPVKLNGHLEIPAGLGVRASIEDGTLQIEQDRPDEAGEVYTHSISLSPAEARQVVDWIAAQIEKLA